MKPPSAGDQVYIARAIGVAFDVVEIREGKQYPYVLQHPMTRERMAYSLGELIACPSRETFSVPPPAIRVRPTRAKSAGPHCDHQWFRTGFNRWRRTERQRCAVVGCVKKRNLALIDCPACVERLDGTSARIAQDIIERRDACPICQGDGLIEAPSECRCCGTATKKAMCGPCLAAHGYRSVVHCDRATADEVQLDETLEAITVSTMTPSAEARRAAEVLS